MNPHLVTGTSSNPFCKAACLEHDLARLDKVYARIKTTAMSRDTPEQGVFFGASKDHISINRPALSVYNVH
jgi:hypothetical protein